MPTLDDRLRVQTLPEHVALSRRVGRLMHTTPISGLSREEHRAFIDAVGDAASFDALPSKWRGIIKLAEAEFEADRARAGRKKEGDSDDSKD